MTLERAAEILNPQHREHYDSLETVEEACRLGMRALEMQMQLNLDNVVVLPCKVGDIVYMFDNNFIRGKNGVIKCKVNEFIIDDRGPAVVLDCVEQFFTIHRFVMLHIRDFGRIIFLDRAAAENARQSRGDIKRNA